MTDMGIFKANAIVYYINAMIDDENSAEHFCYETKENAEKALNNLYKVFDENGIDPKIEGWGFSIEYSGNWYIDIYRD